jgi:hypothetical protein
MVHAETPRVLEYVQAGDRTGLEAYFNGFFHRMKAAGAELAVIPSVTSHFCIEELRASAPLPLAVIFEPVIQEVARRSIRRVAIFGTRFVIRSRLYGFVPELDLSSRVPMRSTSSTTPICVSRWMARERRNSIMPCASWPCTSSRGSGSTPSSLGERTCRCCSTRTIPISQRSTARHCTLEPSSRRFCRLQLANKPRSLGSERPQYRANELPPRFCTAKTDPASTKHPNTRKKSNQQEQFQ